MHQDIRLPNSSRHEEILQGEGCLPLRPLPFEPLLPVRNVRDELHGSRAAQVVSTWHPYHRHDRQNSRSSHLPGGNRRPRSGTVSAAAHRPEGGGEDEEVGV